MRTFKHHPSSRMLTPAPQWAAAQRRPALRLPALARRLQTRARRLQAVALRLQARARRLQAVARRLRRLMLRRQSAAMILLAPRLARSSAGGSVVVNRNYLTANSYQSRTSHIHRWSAKSTPQVTNELAARPDGRQAVGYPALARQRDREQRVGNRNGFPGIAGRDGASRVLRLLSPVPNRPANDRPTDRVSPRQDRWPGFSPMQRALPQPFSIQARVWPSPSVSSRSRLQSSRPASPSDNAQPINRPKLRAEATVQRADGAGSQRIAAIPAALVRRQPLIGRRETMLTRLFARPGRDSTTQVTGVERAFDPAATNFAAAPRTYAVADRAASRGHRLDQRTLPPTPRVVASSTSITPSKSQANLGSSPSSPSAVRWETRNGSEQAAVVRPDGASRQPPLAEQSVLSLREITDHVMRQLDRRMTAVRERMGRR